MLVRSPYAFSLLTGMAKIFVSEIVCHLNDPSMRNPTKFVGPIYTNEEAEKLEYPIKPEGEYYRRVVHSPNSASWQDKTRRVAPR